VPFGPERAWLALPASEPARVAERLRLRTVLPANWLAGLAETDTAGVFVSPAVRGTTWVVGADLRPGVVLGIEALAELVTTLSRDHGRAVWCVGDDRTDTHGWLLAERGELQRGYLYDGERGHVFWHGELTAAEVDLGCFVDDPRDRSDDDDKWWPDARVVLALAERFGADPRGLVGAAAGGVGVVGRL
jgi:hypothetical protein